TAEHHHGTQQGEPQRRVRTEVTGHGYAPLHEAQPTSRLMVPSLRSVTDAAYTVTRMAPSRRHLAIAAVVGLIATLAAVGAFQPAGRAEPAPEPEPTASTSPST